MLYPELHFNTKVWNQISWRTCNGSLFFLSAATLISSSNSSLSFDIFSLVLFLFYVLADPAKDTYSTTAYPKLNTEVYDQIPRGNLIKSHAGARLQNLMQSNLHQISFMRTFRFLQVTTVTCFYYLKWTYSYIPSYLFPSSFDSTCTIRTCFLDKEQNFLLTSYQFWAGFLATKLTFLD